MRTIWFEEGRMDVHDCARKMSHDATTRAHVLAFILPAWSWSEHLDVSTCRSTITRCRPMLSSYFARLILIGISSRRNVLQGESSIRLT